MSETPSTVPPARPRKTRTRITPEIRARILELRRSDRKLRLAHICADVGISAAAVSKLCAREGLAFANDPKLSDDDVRALRAEWGRDSYKSLAAKYGISIDYLYKVGSGQARKDVK